MTKGTPARGKHSGKMNVIACRRCGRKSYHVRKKICSYCSFGKSPRMKTHKKDYD